MIDILIVSLDDRQLRTNFLSSGDGLSVRRVSNLSQARLACMQRPTRTRILAFDLDLLPEPKIWKFFLRQRIDSEVRALAFGSQPPAGMLKRLPFLKKPLDQKDLDVVLLYLLETAGPRVLTFLQEQHA